MGHSIRVSFFQKNAFKVIIDFIIKIDFNFKIWEEKKRLIFIFLLETNNKKKHKHSLNIYF